MYLCEGDGLFSGWLLQRGYPQWIWNKRTSCKKNCCQCSFDFSFKKLCSNGPRWTMQCFGSGSVCFWASGVRILLSTSKKIEINQDFYCFVNSEWHVIFEDWSLCASCTARNKQKKLIFVGILKANAKKRRSRSRILIRNPVYGSKDPDLYENVTNPEHSDNVN